MTPLFSSGIKRRMGMRFAIRAMDQRGAVLFIAIIMLLILSIIGIYAVGSSTVEIKVSAQKRFYDEAFNAADAGIAFALTTVTFGNIDGINPAVQDIDTSDTGLDISSLDVYYLGNSPPPVGSGTGQRVGFRAHYHRIDSTGTDAPVAMSNASVSLETEGFRIGF
jgi:hypothetical protein